MKRIVPALLTAAVVASCGGGGSDADEAGGPTVFSVQPSILDLTGSTPTTCYSGFAVEAFVYGGAAPYYINNTFPDVMSVDKSKIESAGGSFNVTVSGCFGKGVIVIVDKLNKTTTLTITNKLGGTT